MVIDSSAIIAILFDEPEAPAFLSQIASAEVCRISTASLVEIGIVLRRDGTARRRTALNEMLRLFFIKLSR